MENEPKRNMFERIWHPKRDDEIPVRIFFWTAIIACLLLPRYVEILAHNKVWNAVSAAWLVLAVFLRVKIYFKR